MLYGSFDKYSSNSGVTLHHRLVGQRHGTHLNDGHQEYSVNAHGCMYQSTAHWHRFVEVLLREPQRETQSLAHVGVSQLLAQGGGVRCKRPVIGGVLGRSKSERLENAHIVDVVLQGETLNPASGELACSQIGEVAALHQPVRARLDNLPDYGVDELPVARVPSHRLFSSLPILGWAKLTNQHIGTHNYGFRLDAHLIPGQPGEDHGHAAGIGHSRIDKASANQCRHHIASRMDQRSCDDAEHRYEARG